jgi:hypothetical protein
MRIQRMPDRAHGVWPGLSLFRPGEHGIIPEGGDSPGRQWRPPCLGRRVQAALDRCDPPFVRDVPWLRSGIVADDGEDQQIARPRRRDVRHPNALSAIARQSVRGREMGGAAGTGVD